MEEKRRRITVKYKSANPLFEQWLKEWKEEAIVKDSKLKHTYTQALSSLRKCPIRFNSGQELKILKGFGNKLCKILDKKLEQHNAHLKDNENTDVIDLEKNKNVDKEMLTQPSTSMNSSYLYEDSELVPKFTNSKMTKVSSSQELTQIPRSFEDVPDYSQQNEHNLKTKKIVKTKSKILTNQISSTSEEDFYILEPGNFDIILYVDIAETVGNTLQNKTDPLLKELEKIPGMGQYEVKKLNIGDYLWVCRDKTTKNELVLPYIFERKRLDDFASSIKDGRYKEQKLRLKKSGIENIYYLIEYYSRFGLPLTTLQQATINTAMQDGFKIKMTSNLAHTARFLKQFSNLLAATFQRKTLLRCSKENLIPVNLTDDLISIMSFSEFNQSSLKSKPMKVTELFVKMLIQMRGMSVQRALAVTESYPTPILLQKSYDTCDNEASKEGLLENIKCGNRKFGSVLSRTVYQLFNSKSY